SISPLQRSTLLVFLLVSPSRTRRGEFRYSERRNRADGPQEWWRRGCQPTADLTNLDCRRATEIRHERRTAGAFRLAHEADASIGLIGTVSIPRSRCRQGRRAGLSLLTSGWLSLSNSTRGKLR